MKTDWTEEEVKPLMFTKVQFSNDGKKWTEPLKLIGFDIEEEEQKFLDDKGYSYPYMRPLPEKKLVPLTIEDYKGEPIKWDDEYFNPVGWNENAVFILQEGDNESSLSAYSWRMLMEKGAEHLKDGEWRPINKEVTE